MNCDYICEESWYPIMKRINHAMENITYSLNQSFIITNHYLENDVMNILLNSKKQIQVQLQNQVISIADQQRKIARMDRQLNAALNIIKLNKYSNTNQINEINKKYENYENYEKYILIILFGILFGMLVERFLTKINKLNKLYKINPI